MKGHFEIALNVANYDAVDKIFQEVVAKETAPILKTTTKLWGQRTSYITDPEGNLIEIGSFVQSYKEDKP